MLIKALTKEQRSQSKRSCNLDQLCKASDLLREDIRVCGELRDVPCGNPLKMIAFETTLACALTTS